MDVFCQSWNLQKKVLQDLSASIFVSSNIKNRKEVENLCYSEYFFQLLMSFHFLRRISWFHFSFCLRLRPTCFQHFMCQRFIQLSETRNWASSFDKLTISSSQWVGVKSFSRSNPWILNTFSCYFFVFSSIILFHTSDFHGWRRRRKKDKNHIRIVV